jgi:hypothetical protein
MNCLVRDTIHPPPVPCDPHRARPTSEPYLPEENAMPFEADGGEDAVTWRWAIFSLSATGLTFAWRWTLTLEKCARLEGELQAFSERAPWFFNSKPEIHIDGDLCDRTPPLALPCDSGPLYPLVFTVRTLLVDLSGLVILHTSPLSFVSLPNHGPRH